MDGCWGRLCQWRSDIFKPTAVLVPSDIKQYISSFRLKNNVKKVFTDWSMRLSQRTTYADGILLWFGDTTVIKIVPIPIILVLGVSSIYKSKYCVKIVFRKKKKKTVRAFQLTMATAQSSIMIAHAYQVIDSIRWVWVNNIWGHVQTSGGEFY